MKKALALAVSMLLFDSAMALAQRTSVSRDFPIYDNRGKPDLTPDPKRFVSQMEIVDRLFQAGDCELVEGSVGGTGYRRLLRFDTVLINSGDGDLIVGSPTDPNNPYVQQGVFEFSPCHHHYHIKGFSNYQLLNSDRTVAAQGHKQAFCLEDLLKYSNDNKSNGYTCASQGITSGWADWYFKQLSGQWIDITGVPEGDYIVHVEINAAGTFAEGANRYPERDRDRHPRAEPAEQGYRGQLPLDLLTTFCFRRSVGSISVGSRIPAWGQPGVRVNPGSGLRYSLTRSQGAGQRGAGL